MVRPSLFLKHHRLGKLSPFDHTRCGEYAAL